MRNRSVSRLWVAKTGAFSLAEMLFAMGIFSLFMVAVFGLFRRGYQAFSFLQTRQSIQGQVLRLKNVFEADFGLTHLRSVGIEHRTVEINGVSVSRDQISCLVLDDWRNPDNFSPEVGFPLWNRYAVYQTSTEEHGQLQRVAFAPEGTVPFRIIPLVNMTTLDDSEVVGRQFLSSNLRSFTCELNPLVQEVIVSFELEEVAGGKGLDDSRVRESFKASFHWVPGNTVPKL